MLSGISRTLSDALSASPDMIIYFFSPLFGWRGKLLDIILEKDQYYCSWLDNCYGSRPHKQLPFPVYVNLRNYKRFIPCLDINKYNKSLLAHLQSNIRKEKAMYLYNKIRAYKMLGWWD